MKAILDWVARDAETALHPSCTAKMGTDQMSVTDPQTMGGHGIEGLAVVDASVMPYVTNGNIYAPVMMVAEKAADLILGNQPLPPATVPFYRHQPKQQQASDQETVPRGSAPRRSSAAAGDALPQSTTTERSTSPRCIVANASST